MTTFTIYLDDLGTGGTNSQGGYITSTASSWTNANQGNGTLAADDTSDNFKMGGRDDGAGTMTVYQAHFCFDTSSAAGYSVDTAPGFKLRGKENHASATFYVTQEMYVNPTGWVTPNSLSTSDWIPGDEIGGLVRVGPNNTTSAVYSYSTFVDADEDFFGNNPTSYSTNSVNSINTEGYSYYVLAAAPQRQGNAHTGPGDDNYLVYYSEEYSAGLNITDPNIVFTATLIPQDQELSHLGIHF